MILPSKHLSQDRALLTIGARILPKLNEIRTISSLWEEMQYHVKEESKQEDLPLSYDNFVLTLDILFLMGAIELKEGLLKRCKS